MSDIGWIDTQDEFDALMHKLSGIDAYALDTEFHREKSYFPHLALIQIAWEEDDQQKIVVIDPLPLNLESMRVLLESNALAVLHAADQDLEVLYRACQRVPQRLFDTQIASAFLGLGLASLARLVQALENLNLPKGDRLTDWTRRPLDEGQIRYAASDVEYLLPMRRELLARADKNGTREWIEEECEKVRNKNVAPMDPDTAWWKIKGCRSLRGKNVGVAQCVGAWRERVAQKRDLPPRFVLPDLGLASIVQRAPANSQELGRVRGFDSRYGKNGAEEGILEAVAKGSELQPDDLRRPAKGQAPGEDLGATLALGQALVVQISYETGIDPSMLATRADIQALAWGRESGRLTNGWRADIAGSRLEALFAGKVGLSGDGKGGLRIVDLP